MSALSLLNTLEGLGVAASVTPDGKLRLEPASRIHPALLDEVRAAKPEVMAALNKAKEEALTAEVVAYPHNLSRPAWAVLAQQPGHCGSCARWEAHPAPADHMGMCSAGRRAHSELHGEPLAPVEIQAGHTCRVYGAQGYQKRSGAAVKP